MLYKRQHKRQRQFSTYLQYLKKKNASGQAKCVDENDACAQKKKEKNNSQKTNNGKLTKKMCVI